MTPPSINDSKIMTFEHYKKEFTEKAITAGYSEQNIVACLNYAENFFFINLPVIYNTSHFSALVGYNKNYLKRAVLHNKYFYKNFDVIKKNGNTRRISEPLPSLKEIQIWILENILYKIDVSRYAKAYIPKISLRQNLTYHRGQKKVLVIDIENFFSSISEKRIEEIFLSFGYSHLLSSLFSKLCCKDGVLPQGAPTSPYLSNIFMRRFDDEISKFSNRNKIRFTRYADDLTFSGDFEEKTILDFVEEVLSKENLNINKSKTKLMLQNERQIVTGVVVNEKLQVEFKKRNDIRQNMYYIKKFGLQNHMERLNITKANYHLHLLGKINFILHMNPEDAEFIEYKKFLLSLK